MSNFNQTPTHTVEKVKYIYLNLSFFFNLCHQHSNSGRVNLLLKRETSAFVIVFPGTVPVVQKADLKGSFHILRL